VRSLDHVRWVGGGTGAGKSTVARRLAERFGLRIYSTDAAIAGHVDRLRSGSAPLLDAFLAAGMDERWVDRDPPAMYRAFPWFHGEGFDLVVDDLRALASGGVVLAEGFRLLPHLVRPLLTDPRHAVFLTPTPEFRRAAFGRRSSRDAFWLRTGDPERALSNLLARDAIFTDAVAADAARNGLATLAVDGTTSVDAAVDELAARFGLG
jgi:2-phosphoglycerate kinase